MKLKKHIRKIMSEHHEMKKLRVFDFDNTLVRTSARVAVLHSNGKKSLLTAGQYAAYDKQEGDSFDYSEFDDVLDPKFIKWTTKLLRTVFDHHGVQKCCILTARHDDVPVKNFMHDAGFIGIEIVALATSCPKAKAKWIAEQIRERELTHVEFFDDSRKNIDAVRRLRKKYKRVKIQCHHIKHR